ncbi:MAG: hypothetical protein AABX75_02875, partial [Nanoarchaeota archaeon]
MAIEDALNDVAGTLSLTPYSILHEIMDTAPVLHDADTGKLERFVDPKALVMSPHEARMALDYLQAFEMGYASDGAGNHVPVPMMSYEHKPTFLQRWSRAYKAVAIAAAVLTLGIAVSGCLGGSAGSSGEIKEVHYDNGKDGVHGTNDDGVVFEISDRSNGYRVGTNAGENLTYLNDTMKPGGYVAFDYLTGSSYGNAP